MNAIELGARQAVLNCVRVQKGENVVIITDKATEYLANAIKKEALAVGGNVKMFLMENFGNRPDDGVNPLKFPDEIARAMTECQVSFYIAAGKKNELSSFRRPMCAVVDNNNIRHAHMPNFTERMMSEGMASDYVKIKEITKKVHDVVKVAKEIRVTSKAGTDLTVKVDNAKYKWVLSDGDIKPGHWSNLPDGEIFTYVPDANGKVVVDGCFGDFFNAKYGEITNTPLSYTMKNGRCVKGSVECKNAELKKEFEDYTFNTDANSDRLGEFAIGTNTGLKSLIGNLLQDEKFPGVHLALGNPYPEKTGAEYSSEAHNDAILKHVTVYVDGKKIMEDSKFTI